MPGDPKECRENAKRCFEFAQTARTEADRERFEGLAQRWLALATDFEAASVLLGKWSSVRMTYLDHPARPTGNPSARRLFSEAASSIQSPEASPCQSPQTT